MKKIFLCAVIAFVATATYAKEDIQRIITDCGTVHTIPNDATEREACEWLDYWSNVDCGTSY